MKDRVQSKSFIVLSFFLLLVMVFILVPFKIWQGIPLCTIKAITGWPCPGCGLTRGMWHLLHGHWQTAIQFNALTPVVSLILLFYLFNHMRIFLDKKPLCWKSNSGQRILGPLFLILFLSQWSINLFRHYLTHYL